MTKFLKNVDVTGYVSQTSVTSSLVKTDANGKLVAAVAGTDYNAPNVTSVAGTLIREIRNTTGATLTKGTVIYISGATGNKPTVSKALATGDSTSAQTFGICQTDIANNSNGNVVVIGDITGVDTSAFTEGVQLYLSSTTAGTYTATKQLAPAHLVYIGVVTRVHPTQGQIEVKIQNGYELDEIHDVAISSLANNQGLFYESATDLWKNKTIATVLGYTPANGADYLPLIGGTLTGGLYINPNNASTVGLDVASNTIRFRSDNVEGFKRQLATTLSSGTLVKVQAAGFGGTYVTDLGFYTSSNSAINTTPNLYLTGGNNRVGINTDAPAHTLDVAGTAGVSGVLTAQSFVKTGGTSAQFLKADGSVDSSTYLTSYTETDTLATVTGRGAITNTQISISVSTLQHLVLADRFHLIGGSNFHITNNAYYSSAFKYKTANQVNKLTLQSDGTFLFDYAASGTVDANITWTTLFSISNTGTATASSFVRSGGTAAQFLKADGSVDSSTYLTTTSAASTYLPLAGGALTGALNGTTASFSGQITSTTNFYTAAVSNTLGARAFGGNSFSIRNNVAEDFNIDIYNRTTNVWYNALMLSNNGGAATFLGSVTAASFIGNVTGTASSIIQIVAAATETNLVSATIGDNDFFRIRVGGASNAGFAEIATADDGTEPIFVRQYTGTFATLTRTATLLDGSGNTSFPGTVTAPTFSGALSGNATTATTAATANAVAWGNVSSKPSSIFFYEGFTLDANTMSTNASGFTYSVNAPYVGPIMRVGDSGYSLQLNASYGGSGTGIAFRTRNGDSGTFNPWRALLNDANYTAYALPLTGGTLTGNVIASGDTYTTYGPNSTWTSYLRVGGNGRTVTGDTYASMVTTNGNLHLDAGNTRGIYLNYYAGTTGVVFGNGASGIVASMDSAGNLWKGATVGAGTQYVFNSGTWGINITGTAGSAPNGSNINNYYNSTAGEGYGFRFWNGDENYKLSMGVGAQYQYGPVNDYSIKLHMGSGTGRGITMGITGSTPTFAHNTTSGNTQVAGTFNATSITGTGLTINTGGTGTWGPFVVTSTSQWGDGGTQYVTIGAGGAAGIMINNPHIVWNASETAAGMKFGRSGGVSSGAYYVIGTGASDNFFITKNGAIGSPQFNINTSGNATFSGTLSASNLSGTNTGDSSSVASRGTNWNDGTVIGNTIGMLVWKNYGNGHVIFDASASTAPNGASISNTNPQNNWTGTFPTLMGWNGSNTYGVRVDSARIADTANDPTKLPLVGGTMSGTLSFTQPVGLLFANGQYIRDNGGGGLIINSFNAVNINGTAITTGLLIPQGPGGNYNENIRLPGSTAVISFNTSGTTGAGSYNIVSQTNFQIRNAGGAQVFVMDQSGNLSISGALNASGLGRFGTTAGATDQGIGIYYQNYASGYGRIRFYQNDGNHQTIHSFSANWQSGDITISSGAINIDGQNGVTFGGWNVPDAYIAKGGSGWFRYNVTAAAFFESSDATIKTLVADNYQAKGIELIVAKLYTKKGKEELGYFAQDVQGVLPSAVNKGKDGLLNLSYREVHTAKIARLEKEVEELKSQLARL